MDLPLVKRSVNQIRFFLARKEVGLNCIFDIATKWLNVEVEETRMSFVLEDVEGLFGTDVKRILEISVSEVQFVVSEADGDIALNAESENYLQLKLFGDHDLVYALLFSG